MRGTRGLVALAAALAALVFVAPATATFPGKNGFIVFISDQEGNFELYAQNLDGSNFRKFLDRPSTIEGNPSWNPTGRRLVFHSGPLDQSNFDLYLVDADGTGLTPLLVGATNDANPQFCDANTIVFERLVSPSNTDIYAIETNGTGLRQLTSHPAFDVGPTCSPDGTKLAFASTRSGPLAVYELPLAPASGRAPAGTSATLLVSPGTDPDYAPDGDDLVYAGLDPVDGSVEVFTLDLDTTEKEQISFSAQPLVNRFPKFFPSGDSSAARALARPAGDDDDDDDDDDEDHDPVQWTQLQNDHKSTQSNRPCTSKVGRLPLGFLELVCLAVIPNGGVGVIQSIPLCRCKDLTVGLRKSSAGAAEATTSGRRLTRLFFNLDWALTCSGGFPPCRAEFRLKVPRGFSIRSMHRLEKKGKKTVRVPDPNPVSCQGKCNLTRETVTDGSVRVALNSSDSLAQLAGDDFILEVETSCSGRSETTRILVTMGKNGKIKGVRVEQS